MHTAAFVKTSAKRTVLFLGSPHFSVRNDVNDDDEADFFCFWAKVFFAMSSSIPFMPSGALPCGGGYGPDPPENETSFIEKYHSDHGVRSDSEVTTPGVTWVAVA